MSEHFVQKTSVATSMSKYCRYTVYCWYDTLATSQNTLVNF